jgi:glutamate synthase (NADPH/NADH) large chain
MTGGRVVVLGPTGRNFGAGMSGGIAYVHDPDGVFAAKLNGEMVRLQELEAADQDFLLATVTAHVAHTESAVGTRILAEWSEQVLLFKRVMPVDYQRVLGVMQQAEADGLDEEQTLSKVMEASRG